MATDSAPIRISLCFLFSLLLPFVILDDPRTQVIISPKGSIRGAESKTKDVFQYSLRYAQPPVGQLRWRDPLPVNRWNGIFDATYTPPVCPQVNIPSTQNMSEDCLYYTVYSPQVDRSKKLPIFVWLHGGSFIEGGAGNYGLDGSALAGKSQMIVVVVQYRLGLLGFLKGSAAKTNPPIGGNYAVKDVISALSSIREFADTFGGDRDRVTLAGQSSGAEMVKTLLMARSASDLFQRAILHSAPLNYGDHSVKTADAIGSIATSLFNCQDDCYRSSLDVDTILEVQNTLMDQLPNRIPEVAASEPFRPFVDNALITNDFMRALNNPGSKDLFLGNRQIIFTTVKDESAPTIADRAKDIKYLTEIPAFISSALGSLEPNRSSILGSTHVYSKELGFELVFRNRIQAAKETLMLFGSDYIWTCPNQQVAVNLTRNSQAAGGHNSIWLAEFDMGIPYPSTQAIPLCKGKVCHEDDILLVFGVPKDYPNFLSYFQRKLIDEVGKRWGAFAATGSPNLDGYTTWNPVSSSEQLNLLRFGKAFGKISDDQRPWACNENDGFWGTKVRFDSQITSSY
ncbi:hypothetical protein PCANC_02557 [Puccinia coronata f. sp. avenae]|uniref:Carboxylic ester hydrolase n=1 Tax=Puccinia coronata f. sp. avenae TaxID=200324 RepID=A0A2N5VL98_9BASI|nr:hypothetical protein PCASD_19896 [Puccinia coronata f. sp. avenae]PLW21370.1 hypothetical protein PCANC_03851 [Puccinia coronata f. sp. avenae]PLW50768.1 hypothetical protein PCASD_00706 [Puccinia coronata f. sp. avenae]PLW55082.1 hypothetical protein PCANC_02557 [Puccinia coronata f. sp. avenae]